MQDPCLAPHRASRCSDRSISLDQAPVPGQQRGRGHDPVQPQVPRQQPAQGGEHGTVSPVRPRAGDCRRKHRDVMAQHEDLRVLRGVAARQQHQPAEHPDHEQVDETDKHERRAQTGRSARHAGFGTAHGILLAAMDGNSTKV